MDKASVSVVVPAYNCAETLGETIQSILSQKTSLSFEIIVVDDGSTDKTAEVVKSFPGVTYAYQENAGPAKARNHGFSLSCGEYVFFTDSDCLPHPDWIDKMLEPFSRVGIAAVCGSYGLANEKSLLARCIHDEIRFRHQKLVPDFPKVLGSYNFCVKRKVFEKIGGFDQKYRFASGEDNDLSYKIIKSGERIFFAREALVDHYHQSSLWKYLKEQFRHGYWRARMYLDHPFMTRGDDYTFWKDMIEVPLALVFLITLTVGVISKGEILGESLSVVAVLFAFLEGVFAFKMMRSSGQACFFAIVMVFRAIVRTAGFFCGIVNFSTGFLKS